MSGKKGQIAWNKGLTAKIDNRIKTGIVPNSKGKTYKELYGDKKSLLIKSKLSKKLLGKKRSIISKKHISECQIGRKKSIETRKKISRALIGNKPWIKGLTKETDVRVRNMGIKISSILKYKYLTGNLTGNGNNYQHCWYDGIRYLSSYESCFAKFLDYNNIKFEYESKKCRFKMNNGHTYIIDWYLPDYDLFIETKGYCDEGGKYKINWAKNNIQKFIVIDKNTIKYFVIEKYPNSKEALTILNIK
jgi:hypothetical protein